VRGVGEAMNAQAAYDELIRRVREQSLLGSCAVLLSWDEETYMPPGGVGHRGNQSALLAGLEHERATHPRRGELLAAVEGSALLADPLSPAAVNVREIRRSYDRAVRVPRPLVEELARTATLAQQEWAAARAAADFGRFRPWLQKILTLKRREAEAIGYEDSPYDALLEEHEPGARSRELAVLFDTLGQELIPLANAIAYAGRRLDDRILRRAFPVERQRLLAETVAAAVGFDFRRGRLDTALHPFFASIGPGDCRITTRYELHNFSEGLFGTLHEVGHGLYEQGLAAEHQGTPMGEAVSLGMHESQARLWENAVGRSRPFWRHFFPLARHVFPQELADVGLEDFYQAVNRVEPGPVRVGADEVTYNLHILVRFKLEQALVSGDLSVADLPAAWDEAYRHHLGLTPLSDAEGCLQDSHWGCGLIGYFPAYTLGNIIAAQLVARARLDLDDLDGRWARGDFGTLLGWLREKVHGHGCRYSAARLVEQATGSPPDPGPLLRALRCKYGELYGI
jgi:carboxypeptidase Taq